MRIIHLEGRHLASMIPLFKRPRRHGNTTIAPPLLSQNLRRGEENDDDGDDDDGTMASSLVFVPTNVHILLNATKKNLERFIRGGEEQD